IEELNAKVTEKNINGLVTLANDGAFSVYGQESRFGIIHKEFGVVPVDTTIESGTHGQKATFEYVAEKNPQYLFVVDRAAVTGGENSAKELFDNELVAKTDAYKNGNIVYLDPVIWYTSVGGFTSTMKMV
ncbi:ABC transporter substrate-binding protein, partial [Clostridium saudiense]|nr:ABC transporter substrate-binding protein [Clostridium saudiense]